MRNKTLSPLKVIVVWHTKVFESGVMLYVPHYIVVV